MQITGTQVPHGATAVVVNLTGINDSTTPTYLAAFPTGEAVPTISNINLSAGQVDANLAIVQLSSTGQITVFNSAGSADAIVDVEGYFTAPTGSPTAGKFHTMPPLRICDSRAGRRHRVCRQRQQSDPGRNVAQSRALRSASWRSRRNTIDPDHRRRGGGLQPHGDRRLAVDLSRGRSAEQR